MQKDRIFELETELAAYRRQRDREVALFPRPPSQHGEDGSADGSVTGPHHRRRVGLASRDRSGRSSNGSLSPPDGLPGGDPSVDASGSSDAGATSSCGGGDGGGGVRDGPVSSRATPPLPPEAAALAADMTAFDIDIQRTFDLVQNKLDIAASQSFAFFPDPREDV